MIVSLSVSSTKSDRISGLDEESMICLASFKTVLQLIAEDEAIATIINQNSSIAKRRRSIFIEM